MTEDVPMSLPPKEPKGYLQITNDPRGCYILAKKEDADALAPLYLQYGIWMKILLNRRFLLT